MARRTPAAAPPAIRPTLMLRKTSDTALGTAAGGTRSFTIEIVPGAPTVRMVPMPKVTRKIVSSGKLPRSTRIARPTVDRPATKRDRATSDRAPKRSVNRPACSMNSANGKL